MSRARPPSAIERPNPLICIDGAGMRPLNVCAGKGAVLIGFFDIIDSSPCS